MSSAVNPLEQADYDAFNKEAIVDTKIALGEQFDRRYPRSLYQEEVDTDLSFLYFNKGDYPRFYAAAARVLATNPKNVAVLELVGWVIPREYDAKASDAVVKLDEAEKYEKRALQIVGATKKPGQVTQADFANSQASQAWRAHSGLGAIYFRRKDFADSASELQLAIKQEGSEPDPSDLFILGVDLQNLNHMKEAADDFAQCAVTNGGMQEQCQKAYEAAAHAAVASIEEKAFDEFNKAPNADAQIRLGERFDQTYPASQYKEAVDSTLATLYELDQSWTKFYATADEVLAKDPDNVPVLTLVGWTIPQYYFADDLNGPARLDEAEKDDKHALDLIATMPKPADLTTDEFAQAKAAAATRAHIGLGLTYFRRNDYTDSTNELQLALPSETPPNGFDYYILGTDLDKLNRDAESTDAFTKCSTIAGSLQTQCKRDAEVVAQKAAQLAAGAAKPATAAFAAPAAADIPLSTAPETALPIRAETVIVPVRVVVRDDRGRAVADLKKENFKLYQDGKPQQILNFTVVGAGIDRARSANLAGAGREAANSSSSATPAASATRFIVLFFDDVHLYFADMAEIRNAAEKYLSSLQPTDRVAIITSSGKGDGDFTSDRDKLHATIAKLVPHPFPGGSSAPVAQEKCPPAMPYTEASAIAERGSDPVLAVAGGDFVICDHIVAENPEVALEIGESHARIEAERTQIAGEEAIGTVSDKLRDAVRHLAVMPGQRIVVLVSPGFMYGSHAAQFADISNLAIRDNVLINTLDAKGIYLGEGDWNPDRFRRQGFGHEMELAVLQDLADSTGGLFIHFNNDFVGAMREMSEPPEAYYLLGYAPQNLQADGKFRVLKVSLTAGAHGTVQARRGFFAPSHQETPEETTKREIDDAMFSDEVQHDLPVRFETQLAESASGSQELAVKVDIDVSGFTFQKADGVNKESLVVAAALFDGNGNYVQGTQKSDEMNLKDATLALLKKTGFYLEMDFDVKPGNYTVRLVARDSNDQHITAQDATVNVP